MIGSDKLKEWHDRLQTELDQLALVRVRKDDADTLSLAREAIEEIQDEIYESYVDAVRAENLPKTG